MAEHCNLSVATLGDGEEKSHAILETRSHVIKIDGYSRCKNLLKNGERVTSEPFSSGGHNWVMKFYPNGFAGANSPVVLLSHYPPDDVDVNIKFSLLVKDIPVPLLTCYWPQCSTAGFLCNFIKAGSVHLRDDSFSIRCDITIIKDIGSAGTMYKEFVVVPRIDLHRRLSDLLKSMDGADVTFHVSGEKFLAHTSVLAACSSIFKAELFGAMKENSGYPIVIGDMEADVFKSLLYFMYTDSVPVLDMASDEGEDHGDVAMASYLLVAADRYNIERLKLICEERLCNHIDSNMVATSLALADQHGCKRLKEACFEFLASPSNLKAMKGSDGYEHLKKSCPSVVKELITRLLPDEFETVKDIIMEI